MANEIISNGSSLVLAGRSSIPAGMFSATIFGDFVTMSYGPVSWKLDYNITTVDGETFTDAQSLLDKISSFKRGGSSGSGATWDSITDKPAVIASGDTAQEARDAIGAGTSNLVIGTTAGTAADGSLTAPKASPTFTGDPKAPTPAVGDNDTTVATTAFVLANAGKTKTQIAALVSPAADYADMTEATAAIKSIIDALKA